MAFSFGQSTPSLGLFGQAASSPSLGAFGQSTPALGSGFGAAAASTPSLGVFGSSTPAFGASTPAFGASTPSLGTFGASTPALGTGLFGQPAPASTPSLGFGATPAFGAQSTPSLGFGLASSTPAFGAFGGAFGQSTTPTAVGGIAGGAQLPQQPAGLQVRLLTKDDGTKKGMPAAHSTRWDDLAPDTQKELLAIETIILEARDLSRQLDQHPRLHDTAALQDGIEDEIWELTQTVKSLTNAMRAEVEAAQHLRQDVLKLLRNTEAALRTFERVRHRLQRFSAPSTMAATTTSQMADYLVGPPTFPSLFFREAVADLQETLTKYKKHVADLELALAPVDTPMQNGDSDDREYSVVQTLPTIFNNLHDYLIHVAAKVEELHSRVTSAKEAYLMALQRSGDHRNPFVEAERREQAKAAAAAAPVSSQVTPAVMAGVAATPSVATTPAPSLFGGSTPALGSTTPSLFGAMSTPTLGLAQSTPSLFGGATSTATTSTPAFSFAPASTSAFGGATGSSFFGASTPAFASTPSLFGGQSTPSLFGASTPAFGATTPAAGSSSAPSLFGAASTTAFGAPAATPTPATNLFAGFQTSTLGQAPATTAPKPRTKSSSRARR
eukprot:jgi/Chlat1/8660/Chrsp87S08041